MSVSIPLSANAQPVVEAFDQVREAIRRANQEGKSFRDIDLSHPELAGFAQDLARMQQQMEDLLRVSQGTTARAARRVNDAGGLNPLLPEADRESAWERLFTDPAERARLRERAEAYIVRGTSFAPTPPAPLPAPPTPPPSPPSSGSRGNGGREDYSNELEDAAKGLPPIVRSAARAAVQGATFGLSLAGVGGIRSLLAHGYHQATEENTGVDQLMRSLSGLDVEFTSLRDSVRKASEGLGITYQEALRMERSYSRIVGHGSDIDGQSITAQTNMLRHAGGFARGWGIGADGAMQGFARADQSGIGPQSFAAMVGDAAAQGMQGGNIERVMEAILRHQETQARLLVNAGPGDAAHFAAMWAGMNATGAAGLRGENATALIGTMNEALRAGGRGGYASDAVTWHALSRHGLNDPYQMEYFKEGGMFAELPDHATYYGAVRGEINRQYGGLPKHQRLMAMARHFGITMHQAEALDGVTDADMGRTSGVLSKYGLDASNMDPTAYAEISKALRGPGSLQEARTALLRQGDITGDERTALGAASGGKLQELVVRLLAARGMTQTTGSNAQQASADLGNRITEFGQLMVPPMTALKNALVTTSDTIKSAFGLIGQFFSTGPAPGTGAIPFLGGDQSNSTLAIAAAFSAAGRGGRGGFMLAGGPGLGGGAARGSASPAARADMMRVAMDELRRQGVPEQNLQAAAAHLVGQADAESGLDPNTVHDNGTGYGIYGARLDRRDSMLSWLRANGYADNSGEGQMRQMARQAMTDPRYTRTRDILMSGRTDPGAVNEITGDFEKPKVLNDRSGAVQRALRAGPAHDHPHGTPAPAAPSAPRDPNFIQASIEPLVVIHHDSRGNEIARQTLPVRHVVSPMPYGTAIG